MGLLVWVPVPVPVRVSILVILPGLVFVLVLVFVRVLVLAVALIGVLVWIILNFSAAKSNQSTHILTVYYEEPSCHPSWAWLMRQNNQII